MKILRWGIIFIILLLLVACSGNESAERDLYYDIQKIESDVSTLLKDITTKVAENPMDMMFGDGSKESIEEIERLLEEVENIHSPNYLTEQANKYKEALKGSLLNMKDILEKPLSEERESNNPYYIDIEREKLFDMFKAYEVKDNLND